MNPEIWAKTPSCGGYSFEDLKKKAHGLGIKTNGINKRDLCYLLYEIEKINQMGGREVKLEEDQNPEECTKTLEYYIKNRANSGNPIVIRRLHKEHCYGTIHSIQEQQRKEGVPITYVENPKCDTNYKEMIKKGYRDSHLRLALGLEGCTQEYTAPKDERPWYREWEGYWERLTLPFFQLVNETVAGIHDHPLSTSYTPDPSGEETKHRLKEIVTQLTDHYAKHTNKGEANKLKELLMDQIHLFDTLREKLWETSQPKLLQSLHLQKKKSAKADAKIQEEMVVNAHQIAKVLGIDPAIVRAYFVGLIDMMVSSFNYDIKQSFKQHEENVDQSYRVAFAI